MPVTRIPSRDLADVRTVGIPRGLLQFRYGELWKTFFEELGRTVVLSDETDKAVVDAGCALSVDECCLASKAYMGHIANLADRCDAVFVPCYASANARAGFCTKFQSAPDLVRNTFRDAKLRDFGKVIKNALKTLAIVMTLLATAKAFAYMMTELRIPAMITEVLLSVTSNKYVLMLIINILLLLLGCFMDMAPLITIMTPILLPVVTNPAIGMDPVHFGVVMIFNLAVGLCTPPVGSALFVGCAIGKTPIERTSKNMLPLYAVMVTVLLLVTYIPEISLWLPRLTGYAG